MNLNTPFTEYYDDGNIEEEGTLNRKGEKYGKAIGVVRQLPTLLKLNVKYADLFLRDNYYRKIHYRNVCLFDFI